MTRPGTYGKTSACRVFPLPARPVRKRNAAVIRNILSSCQYVIRNHKGTAAAAQAQKMYTRYKDRNELQHYSAVFWRPHIVRVRWGRRTGGRRLP